MRSATMCGDEARNHGQASFSANMAGKWHTVVTHGHADMQPTFLCSLSQGVYDMWTQEA